MNLNKSMNFYKLYKILIFAISNLVEIKAATIAEKRSENNTHKSSKRDQN